MSWYSQASFTSPNSDNAHFVFIILINDTERRVNDLSQMFNMKLRHDTAAQRMSSEPLGLGNDLSGQPFPHIRRVFAGAIRLQVLLLIMHHLL